MKETHKTLLAVLIALVVVLLVPIFLSFPSRGLDSRCNLGDRDYALLDEKPDIAKVLAEVPEINQIYLEKNFAKCDTLPLQECKNACYYALSEFYPDACGKIESFWLGSPRVDQSALQGQCYLNWAEKTKNEEYCKIIENLKKGSYYGGFADKCYKGVYTEEQYCMMHYQEQIRIDSCIMTELIEKSKITPEFCDRFSAGPATLKAQCFSALAVIDKNEEYCTVLPYNDNAKCFNEVAIAKKDPNLCSQAIDPEKCKKEIG